MQFTNTMRTNDIEEQFRQFKSYQTEFPPQLPPLFKGQKIQSGPYTITVTDEMVAQRERENLELYRAWLHRREMEEQEEEDYVGDFKEAAIRRIFIRKVFSLLTVQLLITVIVTVIFMFSDAANKFMIVHNYLWFIAL